MCHMPCRWATIEKEAYAAVYAIEKLRTYLYDTKFTVYTDHKPLKALFTKQMNSTKYRGGGVIGRVWGTDRVPEGSSQCEG